MVTEQLDVARKQPDNQVPGRQLVIPNDALVQAIAECRENPFSPEAVTDYWRAKLQRDGKRIRLAISVPDCDWTEEEIRRPMVDIKGRKIPAMMVYVPPELTGEKGLVKLGRMYRQLKGWAVQKDTAPQDSDNVDRKSGWIKVEASVDAPNLNTTQKQLENFAAKQGYLGQRLNTYILACQSSKALTGKFLDQGKTGSLLLGSHHEGLVVYAYFYSDGRWVVDQLLSPRNGPYLGGRFEEVKKA